MTSAQGNDIRGTGSPRESELPLAYSPEAARALEEGRPLVALESTIISHGMPYPQNLETARGLEDLIRREGATPATMAILDGTIRVGLDDSALELLAQAENVAKVSRRDLPIVVSQGRHGATTVAATMLCARLAGIPVFATGGIGGVHRGAETTWDVSADLQELAHTNVAVVSAGAKAILDIGKTLEYLETQGVPVLGYGTEEFPAFYTRESGHPVDARLDSPEAVARVLRTKWSLGLDGGVLIGNPVPAAQAADKEHIDRAIDQAVREAEQQGITGKAVTPFLLSRIVDLTEGASLVTNVALVEHNARLAARIAVALARTG
jgi:pseudouridine-5'-phosphate glycosidase